MPSSATITAFYNFAANTKARASYVNNNFSTFRGHIIAIDPNTATAATTETYDLGSTEYRWRTGYFREVDFKSNTSTGQALQIVGDTAAGQNAFLMKTAGNIRARIGGGNNYVDLDTTTSQFDFRSNGTTLASMNVNKWVSNIPTSTGQWDFLLNGVTLTSLKTNGLERSIVKTPTLFQVGLNTSGSQNVDTISSIIFTLSVTSNGHPMLIGVNLIEDTTTSYVALINTTVANSVGRLTLYRDGTGASNIISYKSFVQAAKDTSTAQDIYQMVSPIFYDNSLTSGGHTYYLYGIVVGAGKFFFNTYAKLQASEIL